MSEQVKGEAAEAVARAAQRLRYAQQAPEPVLAELWEAAFEAGRLAALDEFMDRFCVCMK